MPNGAHVHLVLHIVFDVELLITFFQLRIKKNQTAGGFFFPPCGVVSPVLAALRGVCWQGLSNLNSLRLIVRPRG